MISYRLSGSNNRLKIRRLGNRLDKKYNKVLLVIVKSQSNNIQRQFDWVQKIS